MLSYCINKYEDLKFYHMSQGSFLHRERLAYKNDGNVGRIGHRESKAAAVRAISHNLEQKSDRYKVLLY